MSFNVGDLVKMQYVSDPTMTGPELGVFYGDWTGRIIGFEDGVTGRGVDEGRLYYWSDVEEYLPIAAGVRVAKVAPPIPTPSGTPAADAGYCMVNALFPHGRAWRYDLLRPCAEVEYTAVPVSLLELVARPKRPKSAAKAPRKKPGWRKRRQETREAIELQKDDEDDAWFLDARAGDEGDDDADFHDAADTREKTLSDAVQSDLAQARSKRKGGRGRRRRRKRTRRTRRRKKRRTRRRRRKRTRRRRRR